MRMGLLAGVSWAFLFSFFSFLGRSRGAECPKDGLARTTKLLESVAKFSYSKPLTTQGREILYVEDLIRRGCVDLTTLPKNLSSEVIGGEIFLARLHEQHYWEEESSRLAIAAKYSPALYARELAKFENKWKADGSSVYDKQSLMTKLAESAKTGASTCTPVDNIAEKLGPVRNQDGAGWCFFYTCADLLSLKLGQQVSAAQLGFILSPTGEKGAGAGDINRLMKIKGLCPESVAKSDFTSEDFPKTIEHLEKLSQMDVQACIRRPIMQQILSEALKETNVDWNHVPTGGRFVTHVVDRLCNGHRIDPGKTQMKQEWRSDMKPPPAVSLMSIIDAKLDHGQPVGIGYDIGKVMGQTSGGHVSSVVGRRLVDGECQYLVRNSWGPTSCLELVSQADHCSPPGHFWVKAIDLAPQIDRVIYVQ